MPRHSLTSGWKRDTGSGPSSSEHRELKCEVQIRQLLAKPTTQTWRRRLAITADADYIAGFLIGSAKRTDFA